MFTVPDYKLASLPMGSVLKTRIIKTYQSSDDDTDLGIRRSTERNPPRYRRFLYPGLLFTLALTRPLPAQMQGPAYLVKDINRILGTAIGSNPQDLTTVGGITYFTADDGLTGRELWRSDGTAAGTTLLKDIYPGRGTSYPTRFTEIEGILFFVADDGANGFELWRSDGTPAGTMLVRDINPGPDDSSPNYLTNVNGTLFFAANDGMNGRELWKTDGTATGTVLVSDIQPGEGGGLEYFSYVSAPPGPATGNGLLYFVADDGASGFELWRSDGTASGTVRVKDIAPGPGSSLPNHLTEANGTHFFTICTPTDCTLWRSEGTEANTLPVASFGSTARCAQPTSLVNNLVDIDGTLFFTACEPSTGVELWRSDGTASGTTLVKDINPGAGDSFPSSLTNVDGRLFFFASNPDSGFELWRSDGTEIGTTLVRDINPGPNESLCVAPNLANRSGIVFFAANDGSGRCELWRSDGTENGTTLVKSIGPPPFGSQPRFIVAVGDAVFFSADDEIHGIELWRSDGTEAGTLLVDDVVTSTADSEPADLTAVNGMLFFTAIDGLHGRARGLWRSDGTDGGTVEVNGGQTGAQELTAVGHTLFFTDQLFLEHPVHVPIGWRLWKTDGTRSGTVRIKDLRTFGPFLHLTNMSGTLYFATSNGGPRSTIWRSDGTTDGTVPLQDLASISHAFPNGPLTEGGKLIVETVLPEITDRSPGEMAEVDGTIFFGGYDSHGFELWKTDLTADGTVMVKDIFPGTFDGHANGSSPSQMVYENGTLFFVANDGTHGAELWKSDGTEAGTVLVKDIKPGASASFSSFSRLTNANGTLFFIADDAAHGAELWRSDGTEAGTVLVRDIAPGVDSSFRTEQPYQKLMTAVGRVVLFSVDAFGVDSSLWRSDGTEEGTSKVQDITPWSYTSLTVAGSNVFFSASGGRYLESARDGIELWALPFSAFSSSCLGDCDDNQRVTVDELVKGVGIALGESSPDTCMDFDFDHDTRVTVDELVVAVNNALNGCV